MKVIAVVGSASGSGKTTLACALLRAIPGLGAVKISPSDGPARVEWGPGKTGKDTARFAGCGAAAVARIVGPRDRLPETWESVRAVFEPLPGVLIEGAGALALPEHRFTIFVAVPDTLGERPARDERLAAAADCIVVVRDGGPAADEHPLVARHRGRVPVFAIRPDAVEWGHESLIEAVRGFLLGKEDAKVSIPLAPPFSKGEESKHGPIAPHARPSRKGEELDGGSADLPCPPSPKGDAGGLMRMDPKAKDD
jgi:hypothetical protein